MRREFPAKVKVAAFNRAGGKCESCEGHLYVGKFHYDHVVADGLGGSPTPENCAVLCAACHSIKTRTKDIPTIAKVKRVARGHVGAKPRSRNPVPGSKASRWKKPFNGPPVLR